MPNSQTLLIEGKTIVVTVSGSGNRNIVFVHGASMSGETWLPQQTDPGLRRDYRMFSIDLPGHGGSQWLANPDAYGLQEMANIVAKTIEAFELDQFILIALSFGTNVTGEIKSPPANCIGLMLVSPDIINHELNLGEVLMLGDKGHVIATENPSDEDLRAYIKYATTNETVARNFYQSFQNTDPAFRKSIGETMTQGAWTDELSNIIKWEVPVCVVFGKDEKLVNTHYLDKYDPLWNGQVIMIENAGHIVNEENPRAFNRLIDKFATAVYY
jgi:pimeloyl-ACP methyl ester carboxylesterase